MAIYKHETFFTKSNDATFDKSHPPGSIAAHSGIYRCEGCGREDACNMRQPLPPQNHHQHTVAQGAIRWRPIAIADSRPK